jgi:tRNA (cytidine/uridine-2'-O-)-methyltransferase
MSTPLLNIVLHQPEIPNNTGNIGRTCVATGCALHLIHPLAFDISEKAVRRAGLDYWHRVQLSEHADWWAYRSAAAPEPSRLWLTTTRASRPVWEAEFRVGDHIVFGRETVGLPAELIEEHARQAPQNLIMLPLLPDERSLNVASTAAAVISHAIRHFVVTGQITLSDAGRIVR